MASMFSTVSILFLRHIYITFANQAFSQFNVDMKLGAVTKLDKRSKEPSEKIDDDVMSANCDVITIFPIYRQFGAIRKTDSGCTVCETYIFNNSNLLSCKN